MEKEKTVKDMTRDQKLQRQKDQLTELQELQKEHLISGDEIEEVTANRNSKYKVSVLEAHMVHVLAVEKHDDPAAKEYKKKVSIVKIHAREFERRVNEGAFKVYDSAEVIHDPRTNAPKTYNLNPDFAKVENKGPEDKNVKTDTSGITGTTRLTPARPPKDKGGKIDGKKDDDIGKYLTPPAGSETELNSEDSGSGEGQGAGEEGTQSGENQGEGQE